MSKLNSVVIVGAGLAGANTAFALREHGFDGRVTVVGDEPEWPYERPPLSKTYLRAEEPLDKAYVRPAVEYERQRIDLRRGVRATAIDVARRRLTTDGGTLEFDALVLATGAAPRRLEVPGARLSGVHYLRNASDSDALREAAARADSIAVVGGGWIGAEVAASLRQLEHTVTLITSRPRPLEHVLGAQIAEVYRDVHREHGVRIVTGRVVALEGGERVSGVTVADGTRVAADLVVVGAGAIPRIDLARDAGLDIADGAVVVDERLRTSAAGIFAAGDIATAWSPRYGRLVHVEHWDNAIRQGGLVAENILGADAAYERVPYFYSDQYDVGMEYRGLTSEWDRVVVRGDIGAREFHAFWLERGHVAAAMNVNLWDDGDELQALVESNAFVDPDSLADPGVPLANAA